MRSYTILFVRTKWKTSVLRICEFANLRSILFRSLMNKNEMSINSAFGMIQRIFEGNWNSTNVKLYVKCKFNEYVLWSHSIYDLTISLQNIVFFFFSDNISLQAVLSSFDTCFCSSLRSSFILIVQIFVCLFNLKKNLIITILLYESLS